MFKQPEFRWFQCMADGTGEQSDLCSGCYLSNAETQYENCLENDAFSSQSDTHMLSFFGRHNDASVWRHDIKILFMLARKRVIQLEQAAIKADNSHKSTDYSELRRCVCELWLASRCLIIKPKEEQYNAIQNQIVSLVKQVLSSTKRLQDLPDYILFNANKHTDNVSQHPSYNLLHLYLDLYWLSLTLDYHVGEDLIVKLNTFEKNIHALLVDLIHVGTRKFNRLNSHADILKQTPFLCSCFKELWLLLQLYVEKLHLQQFCKDFWYYFNAAIKETLKLESGSECREAVQCLWLLYHVATVQGYDSSGLYIGPNYHRVVCNDSMVEQCVKVAVSGASEERMRGCVRLLAHLPRPHLSLPLLHLLWDYYYKRLNTPFFAIHTDTENSISSSQKACDFISTTESILSLDISSSASSYELFLCLLGKHLRSNATHWPKLKGRIYSKLPAPKLAAFTDIGLHNLIQLFFVLVYTVNFNELVEKLECLLKQLPVGRSESSLVVWSAHVSLLHLRVQRGVALSGGGSDVIHGEQLLQAVQVASDDRSRAHLMRVYIDAIQQLVDGGGGLHCHEHILIGSWVARYLRWCSHTDASHLLDILIHLVDKLRTMAAADDWWTVLEAHVLPAVTQLSTSPDAPQQVAELGAALVLGGGARGRGLLQHMLGDTITVTLSLRFLRALLQHNQMDNIMEYQTIIIQAWIRIAVLSIDKSELSDVTAAVCRLPQWTSDVSSDVSSDSDVSSECEPVHVLIRQAGARWRAGHTVHLHHTAAIKRWCDTYFGRLERWLPAPHTTHYAQQTLRVYTCAALLFLHCAPALYIKNKSTCLFYRLTCTLLLPSAVLTNQRPVSVVLSALRRTWHLFVRGITQLDYHSDIYVQRIFKDIVVRYVPHMSDASSPIIRCLDTEYDDEATGFILDKIANTFLTYKSKNTHEFTIQALNLTLEMFRVKCDVAKTLLLVRTMLPNLLELAMFVEDSLTRQITFQIIERLKSNSGNTDLGELVKASIMSLIDKHLAFYSSKVFKLLESLVGVGCGEVEGVVPRMRDAVLKVERMRGVGYDNTLRKGLQRIQEIINQQ